MILGAAVSYTSTLLMVWAWTPWQIYILCFSYGVALAGRYLVGYTYNMELQPKKTHTVIGTTTMMTETFYMFSVALYFW